MTPTEVAIELGENLQTLYTWIHRKKGIGKHFEKRGNDLFLDGRTLAAYKKRKP